MVCILFVYLYLYLHDVYLTYVLSNPCEIVTSRLQRTMKELEKEVQQLHREKDDLLSAHNVTKSANPALSKYVPNNAPRSSRHMSSSQSVYLLFGSVITFNYQFIIDTEILFFTSMFIRGRSFGSITMSEASLMDSNLELPILL